MADEPLLLRTRAEDPVERELASDGEVVHRDKGVNRGSMIAAGGLALGAMGVGLAGYLTGDISAVALVVPAAVAMGLTLMGVVRAVARVAVTRDEVRISKGRTIPLTDITASAVAEARFPVPRGVHITFDDEGTSKTLWVVSNDPETLVAVIERTRKRALPRVRVEANEEADEAGVDEELAEEQVEEERAAD